MYKVPLDRVPSPTLVGGRRPIKKSEKLQKLNNNEQDQD
jgi:hypothetical protein